MKRYKTRSGVVLTTVADQHILVAAKSVRELCPYVMRINDTAAFCWKVLEQGTDFETLCQKILEEYDVENQKQMKTDLEMLLDQLVQKNYLIVVN